MQTQIVGIFEVNKSCEISNLKFAHGAKNFFTLFEVSQGKVTLSVGCH